MAKTESVSIQMGEILDTVSKNVKGVLETASMEVAKETVRKLRNASPRKNGKYARGWKVSKKDRGDLVVHNSTNYQLTHLLENSHNIVNAKGEYGRTSPGHGQVIHIAPVEEWAAEELPRKIMEDL